MKGHELLLDDHANGEIESLSQKRMNICTFDRYTNGSSYHMWNQRIFWKKMTPVGRGVHFGSQTEMVFHCAVVVRCIYVVGGNQGHVSLFLSPRSPEYHPGSLGILQYCLRAGTLTVGQSLGQSEGRRVVQQVTEMTFLREG